jgi:hypothetical protein
LLSSRTEPENARSIGRSEGEKQKKELKISLMGEVTKRKKKKEGSSLAADEDHKMSGKTRVLAAAVCRLGRETGVSAHLVVNRFG